MKELSILRKVEDNNKGMDISFFGTAVVLVVFISFCSIFDYWVLTFAKEQVVTKTELYCFASLAKFIDYSDPAFYQSFETHFRNSDIKQKSENYARSLFDSGIKQSDGFIRDVQIDNTASATGGIVCEYRGGSVDGETRDRVVMLMATQFKVKKLLSLTPQGRIPFVVGRIQGGRADNVNYDNEVIKTRVQTAVRFLFY